MTSMTILRRSGNRIRPFEVDAPARDSATHASRCGIYVG